ncbi:MAG: hypothetical protein CVT67_03540 [Actinobacteria bacterium HGW-Actinobacteria-7]|jgi:hypothetical protein|nr:MAG: hypothetical protein CVT67_03540 [Actinobacteria bacterium HGW-Actinobacteria-7]
MNSNGYDSGLGDFGAAGAGLLGCYFVFILAVVVFLIWLYWRILTKAGYSGWLSLLNLVPFGSLVLMLMLAFGNWPVLQDRGGAGPRYPAAPVPQQPYPPAAPTYQPPMPPAPPTFPTSGDEPPAPPYA